MLGTRRRVSEFLNAYYVIIHVICRIQAALAIPLPAIFRPYARWAPGRRSVPWSEGSERGRSAWQTIEDAGEQVVQTLPLALIDAGESVGEDTLGDRPGLVAQGLAFGRQADLGNTAVA